jgi:hypothetical protein
VGSIPRPIEPGALLRKEDTHIFARPPDIGTDIPLTGRPLNQRDAAAERSSFAITFCPQPKASRLKQPGIELEHDSVGNPDVSSVRVPMIEEDVAVGRSG